MTVGVLHVGGQITTGSGQSTSDSWTSTASSAILVMVVGFNGTPTAGDVTDSKSNTYAFRGSVVVAGGSSCSLWDNISGTRGATHTVLANCAQSNNIFVVEISYGGTLTYTSATFATAADATSPFGVTAAAAVTGSQIALACFGVNGSTTATWAGPGGYTPILEQGNGSSFLVGAGYYKVSESGTPTLSATWSGTVSSSDAHQLFGSYAESAPGDPSLGVQGPDWPTPITQVGSVARGGGGTTSITVAYRDVVKNRLALVGRVVKPSSATFTTPTAAGYTNLVDLAGGTGSSAADTGPTRVAVDMKILDGTESGNLTLTQANTPNSAHGVLLIYGKDVKAKWQVVATSGDDASHGTARAATGSAAFSVRPGDIIVAISASDTDTTTAFTSPTIALTGATITTSELLGAGGVNTGNDTGLYVHQGIVTAGVATGTPSLALSSGPSSCGPTAFILLRERRYRHAGLQSRRLSSVLSTAIDPATAAWSAIAVAAAPVGAGITAVTPAEATWTAVALTAAGSSPVTTSIAPATAAWDGVALTAVAGTQATDLNPATAAWDAVALSAAPSSAAPVALTPATAAWSGTTLTGAASSNVSVALTPATAAWSANSISASIILAGLFGQTVSANKRYLLDQNGNAYFFHGNSPQNMVPNGTLTEMEAFFVDQQARGFNSSQVHLVYNFNADAETSTTPFASNSTLSTTGHLNYWGTIDSMFDLAEAYGFTLWAFVVDNITCGSQIASVTDANCFAYGQFLGNRYKTRPNLIWGIGNDFDSSQWTARNPKYKKIIDGIKDQGDTHLITLWNNTQPSDANTAFDLYYDIDLCYAYNDVPYNQGDTAYALVRTGFPKPWYWGEGTYYGELNANPGPPSSTDLELRKLAWLTITWGGCGHFFGTHEVWQFANWVTEAAGAGIYDQLALIPTEFAGLTGWELMVPDRSHVFQTGGRGTFNGGNLDTDNFSPVAFINGGNLAVAYFPSSRGSITFDTTKLSGTVSAYWLDPVDGSHHAESNPAAPTHPGNNSGGNGDWALVFTSLSTQTTSISPATASWGGVAVTAAASSTPSATLSPTTAAWAAVAATASGSSAVTTATAPATGTWTAVALSAAGGPGAATVAPAEANWTAVALSAAGSSPVTTSATPAEANWSAVALSGAGSTEVTTDITPAEATWSAVTVTAAAAGADTSITPATAVWDAITLASAPSGSSPTDLSPATGTWTAVALTAAGTGAAPATVVPADATWSAVQLGIVTSGQTSLPPAEANWTAVPLTASGVGAVSGSISPATGTWTAVQLSATGSSQVTTTITPATASWSAVQIGASSGGSTVSIDPATGTWTAVALTAAPSSSTTCFITPGVASWSATLLVGTGNGLIATPLSPALATWLATLLIAQIKPASAGDDPLVDAFDVCLSDDGFIVVVDSFVADDIDRFDVCLGP